MENKELKPCPFCKGEDTVEICGINKNNKPITTTKESGEFDCYFICCSFTKNRGCGAASGYKATIIEAIDAWNARSNQGSGINWQQRKWSVIKILLKRGADIKTVKDSANYLINQLINEKK